MSRFTFEYVDYDLLNNSGIPQAVVKGFVNPPSNWDLIIPSAGITYSGTVYNVVTVANQAFRACSNLINCFIPDSVTSVEWGAFYDCPNLTSITLPNTITILNPGLFANSTNLTNIVIPNSVIFIDSAFYNSGLLNIIIPDSVTYIQQGGFEACFYLTSVIFVGNIPYIADYNFTNNSEDTVFYKVNTYNNNRIRSLVPNFFTYANDYTGTFIFINPPQNLTGTRV